MNRRTFLAALVTIASSLAIPGLAQAQNEIVLGHYAAMTGGTAVFGTSADEGCRLAIEELNLSGGVLGRKLKLITEDDQSKPEEARTAVEKLVNQDKVIAIIGEIASSNSIAAAPVAQKAKIPMVSPASTNPLVTKQGTYIFRACFIDPFQGTAMADFAMKSEKGPKAKKIAVFQDVKSDYSKGLREFFVARVKQAGGTITSDESYAAGDKDFRPQLAKIKASNPDAVWVPGYYNEVGLIIRQAREIGLTVPFMGGDGWDASNLSEIAGTGINGCFFSNHYASDSTDPSVQKFVKTYQAKYNGKLPDAMAILGYDSVLLVADAIKRAGSTEGKAIRDALAKTVDFPGAAGKITIDKDRNAQKPLVVLRVKATENGGKIEQKYEYVDSVNP